MPRRNRLGGASSGIRSNIPSHLRMAARSSAGANRRTTMKPTAAATTPKISFFTCPPFCLCPLPQRRLRLAPTTDEDLAPLPVLVDLDLACGEATVEDLERCLPAGCRR